MKICHIVSGTNGALYDRVDVFFHQGYKAGTEKRYTYYTIIGMVRERERERDVTRGTGLVGTL